MPLISSIKWLNSIKTIKMEHFPLNDVTASAGSENEENQLWTGLEVKQLRTAVYY